MERRVPNDSWDDYLLVWKRALAALLGWPESRTQAWADDFWRDSGSGIDWLNHELPEYWIAHLLMPEALRARLPSPEFERLAERLANAIGRFVPGDPGVHAYGPSDWEAARARVEAILSEYGATLPPSRGS